MDILSFLTCSVTVRPVTNAVMNLPVEFLFIPSVCVGDNVADWSWTWPGLAWLD